MTRRVCILALLIAIGVVAGTTTARAKPAMPTPDAAGSDCSWAEAGLTIHIGNQSFRCHCAMLTGPEGQQVLCRWMNVAKLPKKEPAPKKKPDPKGKPKPKPKLVVRVAVPHA